MERALGHCTADFRVVFLAFFLPSFLSSHSQGGLSLAQRSDTYVRESRRTASVSLPGMWGLNGEACREFFLLARRCQSPALCHYQYQRAAPGSEGNCSSGAASQEEAAEKIKTSRRAPAARRIAPFTTALARWPLCNYQPSLYVYSAELVAPAVNRGAMFLACSAKRGLPDV